MTRFFPTHKKYLNSDGFCSKFNLLGQSFLHKILTSGLTDAELDHLNDLINGVQSTPTSISLLPHKANSIGIGNRGTSYVSMEIEEGKIVTGFLCYKDNNNCGLFSFVNNEEEMCSIEIDPTNSKYLYRYEGLDIEEFRRELSDLLIEKGETKIEGIIIKSNDTTTVDGWDVPSLTTGQVSEIYGYLAEGKHVTIIDKDEELAFIPVFGDGTTTNPSIVIDYYWLGKVDYQINAQGTEVAITVHKLGSGAEITPEDIYENMKGGKGVVVDLAEGGDKVEAHLDQDAVEAIYLTKIDTSDISIETADSNTVITVASGSVPNKHVHLMFELEGSNIHFGSDCVLHPDHSTSGNVCFVVGRLDVNGSFKDYTAVLHTDGSVNINIIGATITDIPASNIHIHYVVFAEEEEE